MLRKRWKTLAMYGADRGWLDAQAFSEAPLANRLIFLPAMCKIGKLSYVAGAEIPMKYLGM